MEIPKIQICCSTLNQMVNYIPAIQFEAEKLYCLSIEDDKNKEWDKNLIRQLEKKKMLGYKVIEFNHANLCELENLKSEIINELKENGLEKKSVLWNVTGGQRYFLMAIYDIFKKRDNDYICYFEGNTNEIVILKKSKDSAVLEKQEEKSTNSPIFIAKIDDIEIEDALNLMGFIKLGYKTNKTSYEHKVKFKTKELQYEGEFKNRLELFKIFNNSFSYDEKLRKFCFETKGEKITVVKDNFSDVVKNILENNTFGKIFELMCATKIHDTIIKEKLPVTEMIISQKISFEENKYSNIDEFDIILATTSGKVFIFECKTGGMEGDVAKSTRYSTYAVGGVYGMPILLVPLLRTEITNLPEYAKSLKQTISSAKRANLKEWSFNEIEERLEERLKEIIK